jgi:outer membrane immunogenic protein
MKKLHFCILFFAPIAALAQVNLSKGTIFVGGVLSSNIQNTMEQSNTNSGNIYFQPNAGYFLNSSVAVGMGLGYIGSWDKSTSNSQFATAEKNNSSLFSISPQVRYYIPISSTVFFVPKGQVSVGFGNSDNSSFDQQTGVLTETKASITNASVGITPAFIFFPSAHWGIEAALGVLSFSHSKVKPKDSTETPTTTNIFAFNAGQISLGISYYFYKKK